ncbi:MAG: acylphosphatase [Nitrospirota bacterium]
MPQSVDEPPVRVHILVVGRVQGVGFRAFAARIATRLNLVGASAISTMAGLSWRSRVENW